MHGLPAANWQPLPARFQGPSPGVAFQGSPYIEPPSYAYPHRPQSAQAARIIHGLPTWESSQETTQARPFGYRGTQFLVPAAGMPNPSAPPAPADLTRRLDEMEERSEEEQKQRLRLESKMNENAQTLVHILKELKALRPEVAVPTNNTVAVAVGQVQNHATEEPNGTAGGMAIRVSKRPAQPAQAGSQADESSKRAKTAHLNTPGANKSDSGSSPLSSVGARSTAVFQLRPEAAQPSSEPSSPVETTAPAPSDSSNNAPDLRWAREFLDFIKRMDCTSDKELLSLKKCVKGRVSFDFPLCTDSPTRRSKFCYFLKVGGSLSTTLSPNPGNRPPQPGPDREEVENLNIYETYHDQRCAAAINSAFRAYHPPKYVVPLGEVYRACRSTDGPGEVISTNFLVFMDVMSPRKSIWLMYRYEKAVEDRDRVKWQPVSIHGERDSVFSNSVRPFDTVCLLEDVQDWSGPAEDMIGMGRFEQALPENGQVVLRAAFYTPVLEKMREVLKKGWEPAVDEEEEGRVRD
ncbi:hypothetical protein B0I37DRAFT_427278 [Chaetomium sp. MPI-CAGE-AT-0009]|nr:hypothetical protein B0I37DRAFT_427278 [Chaetomium sp. MPI-CAGE-AT-0009]